MNTKEFYSQLKLIENEKLIKNFEDYNLSQLHELPVLNGIIKLKFNEDYFYITADRDGLYKVKFDQFR